MDMQKGIPTAQTTQEDVVKALSTCCLCGTTLEFTHLADKHNHTVQEAAKCPACGIQTKVNTFILQ